LLTTLPRPQGIDATPVKQWVKDGPFRCARFFAVVSALLWLMLLLVVVALVLVVMLLLVLLLPVALLLLLLPRRPSLTPRAPLGARSRSA